MKKASEMGFPTAVHTAAGWDVRTRSTSWNIFEHTSPKQQLKSKTTTTGIKRFCCSAAQQILGPTHVSSSIGYQQDICEFLVDEDQGWCKDRRFLTCRMLCSCS